MENLAYSTTTVEASAEITLPDLCCGLCSSLQFSSLFILVYVVYISRQRMSDIFNHIIHSWLPYSITQILDVISLVFNLEHNNKNHLYK